MKERNIIDRQREREIIIERETSRKEEKERKDL
jgi:hypothetical protein